MKHGEKFNTLTHFLAAVVALPGIIYLIFLAVETADPWKITSVSIYGATLFSLYLSSTVYHAHNGRFKLFFQKLDHLSIYLLIAGTYTPFMLVTLHGKWGWSILGIVWGLAVIGIALDTIPKKKTEKEDKRIPQLIIYLLMGWLIVIPFNILSDNLHSNGLYLLALGGLLYTAGIIFFVLDYRLKHAHGIWHLFVVGGSVSHYFSISAYVI
ncbi:MAG: hemolysin III family protein [Thiotrichaceae bacterium]